MLKGGQKKLDKNKDGKISGEDFKMMKPIKAREGKMVKTPDGKMSEDKYSKYVRSIKLAEPKDIRNIVKKKPMGYKSGDTVRGDIKFGRALVEAFGSKKTINKMKSNIQDQNRVKKMGGGSLKAVPADNKGLKKLPTEVRNKMGFMKKGGKVK